MYFLHLLFGDHDSTTENFLTSSESMQTHRFSDVLLIIKWIQTIFKQFLAQSNKTSTLPVVNKSINKMLFSDTSTLKVTWLSLNHLTLSKHCQYKIATIIRSCHHTGCSTVRTYLVSLGEHFSVFFSENPGSHWDVYSAPRK